MNKHILDRERLEGLAEERKREYRENQPFPHILVDGVVPEGVVDEIIAEFPGPGTKLWRDKTHEYSKKSACNDVNAMGPVTRQLLMELSSGAFVDFLEALTGISGIVSDPHLEGGGLHQIQRDGFLDIHADFNVHPRLFLERRLNLLLFLNRNWKESYGGHLELWNGTMNRCEKRILPVANRMVIFNTTDTSFHGHPEPLRCPEGRTRNSMALYYYTKERPKTEKSKPHSTLYRNELTHWRARIANLLGKAGV